MRPFFASITQGKTERNLNKIMSQSVEYQEPPVTEPAVPEEGTLHVMVLRVANGGGGYVRHAHWALSGEAVALIPDDASQDVPRARAALARLMKHLRGEDAA
jgi:hypothetical protein